MKLLLTGAYPWKQEQIRAVEALGHETTFIQDERIPLQEQGIDPAAYEGVVGNGLFLYTPIEQFTSLRYIQLTSAGFDRVPMDYVQQHGIVIRNARGVYSVPMAEFALCGVLQLFKGAAHFLRAQQEHAWRKHRGLRELAGSRVCVVGCGSVGMACAERFGAMGCKVSGVDVVTAPRPGFDAIVPLEQLEAELPQADVVVLTLPLTKETRHLINAARLARMKPGAVLVNIARGAVVDTAALTEALTQQLGGAVLDVFEEEPLGADSPLWDMPNVILTPHNSFVGDGNNARMAAVIMDNLRQYNE
ncbi:MAG: D-2-hydroxyacid dehydrogenase [Clostridia bacterium]|nr:D-2-hydroxyacid dehydrogenase [Clostridia bacterium]